MTTAIVQARMTSTRLPGKCMLPLAGEPIIRHVLRAAKASASVVVCAVPDTSDSAPLEAEARQAGCFIYFGPEDDVLARFHGAARIHCKNHTDTIIRLTADCPMLNPLICRGVASLVELGTADYASNVLPRTWPKGLDCEAFTFALLERTHQTVRSSHEREHVTPFMQVGDDIIRANLPGPGNTGNYCIDTTEDYRRLTEMFGI